MSLRYLAAISTVVASCTLIAAPLAGQSPSPAPRPSQPAPADPPKPFDPPKGQTPSPRLPITIGSPSGGAGKEKAAEEEKASPSSVAAFIQQAGYDAARDMELDTLAQAKAVREDVRAYARRLSDDHKQVQQGLMTIADSRNVTIPAALSSADQAAQDKLRRTEGAAFDRAYISLMVERQANTVSAVANAAASADQDVKAFATKSLPTLKRDLDAGRELERALK